MMYNKDTKNRKGAISLDIGAKIRAARLAKGMTQEELGEILGVQKSAIAKYENGRIVNIKRSTLKKISDVLDIPPFELVFEENHQKMQKNNSIITDAVVKMRTDADFLSIVETLCSLDSEKLKSVNALLSAFSKAEK